jgi:methionyl aminopeptidase
MTTRVKTPAEIVSMKESGRQLATVLQYLKQNIAAGMSTKQIANLASEKLQSLGGKPAFLGYYGFPDVICISINDEVVHGIPSENRIIKKGDIVSLDFGVKVNGMITDAAISVVIGDKTNSAKQKLVDITEAALFAGIETIHDGVHVGTIANAIETVLNKHKYGIVRDLVGHGVGHELHEEPNIPNYGRANTGMKLKAGMTIAVEPMATLQGYKVYTDSDGWTIKTVDKSLAAHFEHTILVTETGYEILTAL